MRPIKQVLNKVAFSVAMIAPAIAQAGGPAGTQPHMPEPSGFLVFGAGLLIVGSALRRKR